MSDRPARPLDLPRYQAQAVKASPPLSTELAFCLEISLLVAVTFVAILGRTPSWRGAVDNIAINFLAVILEALPFMLLGSLAGGLIEVFVPASLVDRALRRRPLRAIFVAGALGFIVPVCECAIVPVVRRLLGKGVPLGAAIAFLLAGPIVNPLVLWSTAVAYRYDWLVVALRLGCGYVIAVAIGLATRQVFARQEVLVGQAATSAGCCACGDDAAHDSLTGRLRHALQHAADDFFAVGRFLVIGAFVAAVLRSSLSLDTFTLLAADPWLAIVAMMVLAVLLNLCSEADAFIAATFRDLLPLSAQMAFMVLGPMLDIKLLLMYLAVFRKRLILWLCLVVPLAVFAAAMAVQFLAVKAG